MAETEIGCPACGGCGKVPFAKVHPRLARLCERLYAMPPLSAADLWRANQDECGVTGFNNRLEKLRRLGFVEREKRGRAWLYRLTEAGKEVARQ